MFCHGQLDTGATRATHPDRIKFAIRPNEDGQFVTRNVVYKEVLPQQTPPLPPPSQVQDGTGIAIVSVTIDLDYTGPYDDIHEDMDTE